MSHKYDAVMSCIDEAFPDSLQNDPILILFLDLIKRNDTMDIEISKKVKGDRVYPARINLRFRRSLDRAYEDCIRFLKNTNLLHGIIVNYTDGFEVLSDTETGQLRHIILGLDLREDTAESRVKIWFDFINCPNLIAKAIEKHGYNEHILTLINRDQILIGYDFYLNGSYNFRIHFWYEDYPVNKLIQMKLTNKFREPVRNAMQASHSFMFTFRQEDLKTFIYFAGHDIDRIIKELGIRNIAPEKLMFRDHHPEIIGMFQPEIETGCLSEYNLYYTIA